MMSVEWRWKNGAVNDERQKQTDEVEVLIFGKDCGGHYHSNAERHLKSKYGEENGRKLLCCGVQAPRTCLSDSGGRCRSRVDLGRIGGRSSSGALSRRSVRDCCCRAVGIGVLRTVFADVPRLTALVAGLACSVQRPTIWSSAVARDVALYKH